MPSKMLLLLILRVDLHTNITGTNALLFHTQLDVALFIAFYTRVLYFFAYTVCRHVHGHQRKEFFSSLPYNSCTMVHALTPS